MLTIWGGERHTSEKSEFLKDCFQRWEIAYKVSAVVSDNAAIISAAIRLGGWRHIGCFAHQINLVVRRGLAEI